MAFDPNYASNGRFFVSLHRPRRRQPADLLPRAARPPEHRQPVHPQGAADDSPAVRQPQRRHDRVRQGREPLLGLGDGGSEGDPNLNGQKTTGFLSKILRINVSGPTPKVSIYAYGLRNPWRFSFDRLTGALWIGDVGQDRYEEIDHLAFGAPAGTNFGWSYYEGNHVYKVQPIDRSRLMFPVAEYAHNPGGNCAVTGGYVYRGTDIPFLYGWYVFGDFCSGRVWKMDGPTGRPQPMAISGKVQEHQLVRGGRQGRAVPGVAERVGLPPHRGRLAQTAEAALDGGQQAAVADGPRDRFDLAGQAAVVVQVRRALADRAVQYGECPGPAPAAPGSRRPVLRTAARPPARARRCRTPSRRAPPPSPPLTRDPPGRRWSGSSRPTPDGRAPCSRPPGWPPRSGGS